MNEIDMTGPVTALGGIGPKTAAALARLEIRTVMDLVGHYPQRFDFYPEPEDGPDHDKGGKIPDPRSAVGSPEEEADPETFRALRLMQESPLTVIRKGRFVMTQGSFSFGGERVRAVWYNMPYLKNTLKSGEERIFFGKVKGSAGRLTMEQPKIYREEAYRELTGRPVPVYGLTEGITEARMRSAVQEALKILPKLRETLPDEVREELGLIGRDRAVRLIHAPASMEDYEDARKRLVFDELYTFLKRLAFLKENSQNLSSGYVLRTEDALREYRSLLPFRLTEEQEGAVGEIAADLSSGRVMNRLLQGDVGSGKTAVAGALLFTAVRNGTQGAIMAPTEVLAKQHYATFTGLLKNADPPVRSILLTGSMRESEKKRAREMIASGEADLVIGTHALIQESVRFKALSAVVTDEQHRFGVGQRKTLGEKGNMPHTLVMSATPIPRTLAVILYGDLDISAIRHKPSGRKPIKNAVIRREDRPKALLHIRREIEAGHQAYIICPLVEESELCSAENVTDYSRKLSDTFKGIASVGCLHGRMREEEKQAVMDDFAAGRIKILVSTTVVEVGIDVPNATVMMIENAERFGLSSLHQLRGRVGRGNSQSYCIFVQGKPGQASEERLDVLKRSNDGFEIAAEDLRLRGPGQLFGFRQSGELFFKLADLSRDHELLKAASGLVKAEREKKREPENNREASEDNSTTVL